VVERYNGVTKGGKEEVEKIIEKMRAIRKK